MMKTDYFNLDIHINIDLVNMDVKIDEENKVVILLNSLPDEEYETFTLTLINGRQILNYNEVSAVLVNYEVRRQDRLSSHGSTSTEALAIRDKGSYRKGKGDLGRSKSRPYFRDLKKNQCAFCKELRHKKVDCSEAKSKKESKTEANLARVVSTHISTSQAGGSDSDSSIFSFSITTPIVGYSGDVEWILDTGATYHVCPNRDWFSNFEKLDRCSVIMGDDRPCNMEGIGTIQIKMFDGMIRELKEVRYVPQFKRNIISIGALKILGLEVSIKDGILKITKGSMVVLKGVRRNNLYYLKGSTVTGHVTTSIDTDDDSTKLRHMRFRHTGEKSLQALAK